MKGGQGGAKKKRAGGRAIFCLDENVALSDTERFSKTTEVAVMSATVPPLATQLASKLHQLSEQTWLRIGSLATTMEEWDRSLLSYEAVLRINPNSLEALRSVARQLSDREQFYPAAELWQRVLAVEGPRVDTWAELALCWLGMDDLVKALPCLQKATMQARCTTAGQSELAAEEDPDTGETGGDAVMSTPAQDASAVCWYAMGLYYDRIGNDEAALESFLVFIAREQPPAGPNRERRVSGRSREAHYRVGVLYRLQGRLDLARQCFEFVLRQCQGQLGRVAPSGGHGQIQQGPSAPETTMQLAQLDEAEGATQRAKSVLERLLLELTGSPSLAPLVRVRGLIAKTRQRLGCLVLSVGPGSGLFGPDDSGALALLLKATEEDPQDPLNWYYTGRIYLQLRQPTKAYDAYQQAVYRDGRNAAFWNSIGILYYSIGQYRDALDAYTRAVHHAASSAAVWWNLGLLYEACNAQIEDAREAYSKGLEFVSGSESSVMHTRLTERLALLSTAQGNGGGPVGPLAAPIELDAGRFVIRNAAMFPRMANGGRGMGRGSQVPVQMRRPYTPHSHPQAHMHSQRPMYHQVPLPAMLSRPPYVGGAMSHQSHQPPQQLQRPVLPFYYAASPAPAVLYPGEPTQHRSGPSSAH